MAVSDSAKLDYLWKKLGYGATKTAPPDNKEAYNESIPSPLLYRGDLILTDSGNIPNTLPAVNTDIVTIYKDNSSGNMWSATIECQEDFTAPDNRTWKTNLTNWVPTQFGPTYLVKVYVANVGVSDPQTVGTQLFQAGSGTNDEWFFDYQSGVLNFNGSNVPAPIAPGVTGKSIYISGARYTGPLGVVATGGNGTVAGSNTQVQFNDNGAFGGNAGLTYNKYTQVLTVGSNVISAGNVAGTYIFGNGFYLSGITGGSGDYSNANVAAYLPVYNGNILIGNAAISGDAVITGNLRVDGNTTYINVSDLIIEDKDIIVGANATAVLSDLDGAGLQIGNIAAGGNITFFYNSTSNLMALSHGASIANTLLVDGAVSADSVELPGGGSIGNTANGVSVYFSTYAEIVREDGANAAYVGVEDNDVYIGATNGVDVSELKVYPANISVSTPDLTVTGNILTSSGRFVGNGSGLTDVTGANVTGTVPLANRAQTLDITGSGLAVNYLPLMATTTGNGQTVYATNTGGFTYNPSTSTLNVPLLVTPTARATEVIVQNSVQAGEFISNTTISANSRISSATDIFATGNITGGNLLANGNASVTGYLTTPTIQGTGVLGLNSALAGNGYLQLREDGVELGTDQGNLELTATAGNVDVVSQGTRWTFRGSNLYSPELGNIVGTDAVSLRVPGTGTGLSQAEVGDPYFWITANNVSDTVGVYGSDISGEVNLYGNSAVAITAGSNSFSYYSNNYLESTGIISTTDTVITPTLIVNRVRSDDSSYVTVDDGLDVNGEIVSESLVTRDISAVDNVVTVSSVVSSNSNISTTGNVIAVGNIYADTFVGNYIGNLAVAGSNTQVLFNLDGNVAAVAALTFDPATSNTTGAGNATFGGNIIGGNLLANSNIIANGFLYGNAVNITAGSANRVYLTTATLNQEYPLLMSTGSGNQFVSIGLGSSSLTYNPSLGRISFNSYRLTGASSEITAASFTSTTNFFQVGNTNIISDFWIGNALTQRMYIGNVQTIVSISGNIRLGGNIIANGFINSNASGFRGNQVIANSASIAGNLSVGNISVGDGIELGGNISAINITASSNVTAGNVIVSNSVDIGGNLAANTINSTGANLLLAAANNVFLTTDNSTYQWSFLEDGTTLVPSGISDSTGNSFLNLTLVNGPVLGTDDETQTVTLRNGVGGSVALDPDNLLTIEANTDIIGNTAITGNLDLSGNITVTNNAVITGNLRVLGNTTFINANTLVIDDKDIVVANNAATASDANGAGILVGENGQFASIVWLYGGNLWDFSGNIAADYVFADQAEITGNVEVLGNANVTGNISGANINIPDDGSISLGDSRDLQIYHDGTNSYIQETGTGGLIIDSAGGLQLRVNYPSSENALTALDNGNVVIYYNNSPRITTTSTGFDVSGSIQGNGNVIITGNLFADRTNTNFVVTDGVLGRNSLLAIYSDNIQTPATYIDLDNLRNLTLNANANAVITTNRGGNSWTFTSDNRIIGSGNIIANNITANTSITTVDLTVNTIRSDDSTFVVVQDGLDVNGTLMVSDEILTDTNVVATGNATAQFFIGDGRYLTNINSGNITGSYGNANVANYLPTYSGNISAGNIDVTSNVTAGNIIAITSFTAPSLQTTGNLTANNAVFTGNLTANYATFTNDLLANNANFTGTVTGITANALFNYLSTTTGMQALGGNIQANSGFVSASYFTTSGTGNITATSGNLVAGQGVFAANANITSNVTAANLVATSFISGDGSKITGRVAAANLAYQTNITSTSSAGTYALTFISGTTGGPQLQYIDNNSLTWNPSTDTLTVGVLTASLGVSVNGSTGLTVRGSGGITAWYDVMSDNVVANNTITANTFVANLSANVSNLSISGTTNAIGNITFGNLIANAATGVSQARLTRGSLPEIGVVIDSNGIYAGSGTPLTLAGAQYSLDALSGNIFSSGRANANIVTARSYFTTNPVAVGSLPAAATAGQGARSFVTDADSTTFANLAVGGGANAIPVYSDGTNWRLG